MAIDTRLAHVESDVQHALERMRDELTTDRQVLGDLRRELAADREMLREVARAVREHEQNAEERRMSPKAKVAAYAALATACMPAIVIVVDAMVSALTGGG